ncbi:MAG TPA: DoxX family protein [Caldimonas sp.]|jgi:putative oxidoreductase
MAILSNRAAGNRDGGIDVALLILRLVLGLMILLHGISKLPPPPPAAITGMLAHANLPAVLAWGVYVGEIVGPILLIVGVWARLAAVLIAINMVIALLVAHTGQVLSLNQQGGYALELQAMYLFTAIALALTGAGRFSVGGRYGPMN